MWKSVLKQKKEEESKLIKIVKGMANSIESHYQGQKQ